MKSKQCLDVQQMQHLQELGIKLSNEPLLTWIVDEGEKDKPMLCMASDAVDYVDFSHYCLPAYTLQDVLDALPTSIRHNDCTYYLGMAKRGIAYDLYSEHGMVQAIQAIQFGRRTLIDAAYEMLVWAIENKFVETNKNE